MLSKYKDSQKMFYNYFVTSNKNGHLSHAYLIETNGISYANNLVIDLAKFFLCNGVFDEKICNLVDKGNCPNFKIIGSASSVKKGDVVSLKSDFSMKSVDNARQVYVIYDVQNLNKSAANSLLKFLEEPEGEVFAILVCDNSINVLPTLLSRCQTISLINNDNVYNNIFVSLYDSDADIRYEEFVNDYVNKFFDIYFDIEKERISVLGDNSFYDIKDYMREFLCYGYYLYYDVLNFMLGRKLNSSSFDIDIKKIAEMNNYRDIIRKMEIIDRFIYCLKYNVNLNLFIDNFVISLGGV